MTPEMYLHQLFVFYCANALLIHPTDQRTMPVIEAPDPAFTLTSNQGGNHIKALLENAKIKALDIACLARLQSFPDDYKDRRPLPIWNHSTICYWLLVAK